MFVPWKKGGHAIIYIQSIQTTSHRKIDITASEETSLPSEETLLPSEETLLPSE